jgi:Flp pilus assembly protein TadG
MFARKSEKGQALIIFVFAIIGMVGLTGLAVDGGLAFSDRRSAQTAADSAAWAAALAYGRGQDVNAAVQAVAATNGYVTDGDTTIVNVTVDASPPGECPGGAVGEDITIQIQSQVNPYFAPAVGITELRNSVEAITRSCGTYTAPPFTGNAIVTLAPDGIGYDAHGTPDWMIADGGIFSNSNSGNAVSCGGSAGIITTTTDPGDPQPGINVVGGTSLTCSTVDIGQINTDARQLTRADYLALLPPTPTCDGIATFSSGAWHAQAGSFGSNVAFDGDMIFAPGLYCVTNSPGPYHGQILGTGVTFYITHPDFELKFNGGGNLSAASPNSGPFAGVLIYLAPQFDGDGNLLNTQAIDIRGNGMLDFVGSIIAPSADVTMFGNSGAFGYQSQVIAYQVDSGGNADIQITYYPSKIYNASQPITISLIK